MAKEIRIQWKDVEHIVLVDDDAYELLNRHTWYIMYSGEQKKPYAFLEVYSKGQGKRMVYMHQLVTGAFTQTDHIDLNTLNNQFLNLRPATYQENGWNKPKNRRCRHGECTSKYKGVSYAPYKGRDRWLVLIKHVEHGKEKKTGKLLRCGYFWDEVEAAMAYNKKIVELRCERAWVNPIPAVG